MFTSFLLITNRDLFIQRKIVNMSSVEGASEKEDTTTRVYFPATTQSPSSGAHQQDNSVWSSGSHEQLLGTVVLFKTWVWGVSLSLWWFICANVFIIILETVPLLPRGSGVLVCKEDDTNTTGWIQTWYREVVHGSGKNLFHLGAHLDQGADPGISLSLEFCSALWPFQGFSIGNQSGIFRWLKWNEINKSIKQ